MSNHIYLFVPGLRPAEQLASELGQLPASQRPPIPNLDKFLSRAEKVSVSEVINNDFLVEWINGQLTSSWPLANWRAGAETTQWEKDATQWLCADPVYIHPDRTEALLYAHEELAISDNEAQAMAELINSHFQDEPWNLHVASTHRWYIHIEEQHQLDTTPLKQVKGKNIFNFLPSGEHGRYWQQCMNEIQMLLHGSEANQQRERLGKIPVNSLWLWGSGMQQALPVLPMEVIYSDDPVIQGLAIFSGKKTSALPVTANDIELAEGDIFIHFDVLENCLLQQDISCWLQGLQQFEQDWLGPLMTRIKQQSDLEITLIVAKDEAYQLTQKQLASWLGAFFARNRTGLPF